MGNLERKFCPRSTTAACWRQPMNSGSSSSDRLVRRRQSAPARSAPSVALTAAMIARPSRAGVMMACCTSAEVSSTPGREIGHQAIDLVDLCGCQRRGPGRFLGDRVGVGDERTNLLADGRNRLLRRRERLLRLRHGLLGLFGNPGRGDERRSPESRPSPAVARAMTPRKTSPQSVTTCPASPAPAAAWRCAPGYRPRGRARPRRSTFRAGDSGTHVPAAPPLQPSRDPRGPARSGSGALPRRSTGVISSATAAPVTAPSTNARITVPAADPSSLDISSSSGARPTRMPRLVQRAQRV